LNKRVILAVECKWFQVCPMKRFWDEGRLDRKWVDLYCNGKWQKCKRLKMQLKGIPHPDNMLPNGKIDERLLE